MSNVKLSLSFMREFKKNYRQFVSKLIAEHGDAFKAKGFFFNLHFLANPTIIEHVLFQNYSNYIRPPNKVIELLTGVPEALTEKGHEDWSNDRFNAVNPFLNQSALKNYTDIIVNVTEKYLNQWETYIKQDKPIAINTAFLALTLEIFAKSVLADPAMDYEYVCELVREAHYLLIAYEQSPTKLAWMFPTEMRRRTQKIKTEFDILSSKIVSHCLSESVTQDNLVRSISKLRASDQSSNDYLRSRVTAFLLGGFDTVGVMLAWFCMHISLYPLVCEKVYQEVIDIIGSRKPTADDVGKLTYTQAVILETLRLHALPFLPRMAVGNDTVGNYVINKNDRILIPIFYMHQLPQYWKNPEGFDPERFLKPLGDEFKYVYLSFSAGPRGCLGRNFALNEMIIIIAMMMQRYKLSLTPYQHIDPDYHFFDPRDHTDVMMKLECR